MKLAICIVEAPSFTALSADKPPLKDKLADDNYSRDVR